MKNLTFNCLVILFLAITTSCVGKNSNTKLSSDDKSHKSTPTTKSGMNVVVMKTNRGEIHIELNGDKAPITVKNFLDYVDKKYYDGTIFHRVIGNFMIQGGGFTKDLTQKKTESPIKNEADNGLVNTNGTVAMARTSVVDSATSQFFINLKDNTFLNHRDKTPRGYGYTVFGRVIKGMPVVNQIKMAKVMAKGQFQNLPTDSIVIESIRRK